MKLVRVLAIGALVFGLSACGTTAILERGASSGPTSEESVVVMGVNQGYRVMVFPGEIVDGSFKQNPWLGAVINGVAADGYIVAKVQSGQVLGLTSVTALEEGLWGKGYNACGGARVPVFQVPKGKLLYLTHVRYEPSGGKLSVRYENRIDAAAAYVRNYYPQLKSELLQVPVEALRTAGTCSAGTVYIPIYIGR